MIGYLFIFHIIPVYFFFTCFPFAADYFVLAQPGKAPRDPEAVCARLNAVLLVGSKVALGVAQVIYSVQQVGFSAAVGPRDAGDRGGKRK